MDSSLSSQSLDAQVTRSPYMVIWLSMFAPSFLQSMNPMLARTVKSMVKRGWSIPTLGTGGGTIEFQFPPKILSETNSSKWLEEDLWAIEPLKIHRGSSGRSLDIQWEYIATDARWNAQKISTTLRKLKSYFFEWNIAVYPVVKFKYTEIIPEAMNFRLMNCNITYGEELVNNGGIYPLYTKVQATLELATSVNVEQGFNNQDEAQRKAKIEKAPLIGASTTWY